MCCTVIHRTEAIERIACVSSYGSVYGITNNSTCGGGRERHWLARGIYLIEWEMLTVLHSAYVVTNVA